MNEQGAGITEYGLVVALITVVAIYAFYSLAEGMLVFRTDSLDEAQYTMDRGRFFRMGANCPGENEGVNGGAGIFSNGSKTKDGALHVVSWCTGTGDGSHEIGNSLNKLSVKYPSGTDLSGATNSAVGVKLNKDEDIKFEKDATDDVSGVNANGSNLIITLTGNYNLSKKDTVVFIYNGVDVPDGSNQTAEVSINGDAPDAGDETQDVSL